MGDFKDSKRHGIGSLLTGPGGSVLYNGSWLCGVYHGDGLLIKYMENNCTKNVKSRRPSLGYRGNKEAPMIQYEGSFVNGLRHGPGTLKSTIDNYEYEGEWHKDVMISGRWRISIDGSIYSGGAMIFDEEAENDTYEDLTKVGADSNTSAFDNGDISTGSAQHTGNVSLENEVMKFPLPHGFGTMKYKNGDVYVGQFEKGECRLATLIIYFNQIPPCI